MVWPCVKEGRGGNHQEDVKHATGGKETTEMVWPLVKEGGRGGYHQEDVKHATGGKETTEMVWPLVKEGGRGGYHQEDVKHATGGKETTEMVWPCVKEGRGGYTKKMLNIPLVGKRRLRWYGHVLRKEGEVTPRRC